MSGSKVAIGLFLVLVIGALIVGGCAYGGYRRTITLDEAVKKTWADVEVMLQRRFDLIPNIVRTVKGAAGYEKEVLTNIAQAREKYLAAGTVGEKAKAASIFDGYCRLILSQPFPELQATQGFRDLQVELEGSENRLAERRTRYNDAVRSLNSHVRGFPGSMYAGWASVKPAEYYRTEEAAKDVPKVDL